MPALLQRAKPPRWTVNAGLVAPEWRWAWRGLRRVWLMDEGGGGIHDSSPFRSGISPLSGPVWEVGPYGLGLSFDGSNDFVTVGDIDLDFITILALVKADAATKGYVLSKNFAGIVVPYHLNIGGNNAPAILDGMAFFDGFSWRNSGLTTDIRGDGNWHLVAGTYDGATLKFFVDGALDASVAHAGVLPKNDSLADIGRYALDVHYFGGSMTLVALWDHALSESQIKELSLDPFGPFRMAPMRRMGFVVAVPFGFEQLGQTQPVFDPVEIVPY